jgi:hypothetical protein
MVVQIGTASLNHPDGVNSIHGQKSSRDKNTELIILCSNFAASKKIVQTKKHTKIKDLVLLWQVNHYHCSKKLRLAQFAF